MSSQIPKCAIVGGPPPEYTSIPNKDINYELEIQQLRDELESMKKKEEERLQDSRDLFEDASNSIQSACTIAMEKLVQTTFSKVAEPVMSMLRNHENNQTTSLFPTFDLTQRFDCIPDINSDDIIRNDTCRMLSIVLLPKETIIACVPIHRNQHVSHQLFTSLGRHAMVRYTTSSYDTPTGVYPIDITGDPVPLTSEYIEIAKMIKYPCIMRTDFFDKLLEIYKTHYPLASDMQKNDSMIKELKSQQSVTIALHDDVLAKSEILEDNQQIYEQERKELAFEKEQLKKRLQAVATREKECDIRHNISNIRSELIGGATALLDACDTVENEIIGSMVERAIETINSILK